MKKIFTLSSALFLTIASFADYAPSRLNVSAAGYNNIRVTIDEGSANSRFSYGNSSFEDLCPGYHTVRVYRKDFTGAFFGVMFGSRSYRLLYSATVDIKPMHELDIVVSRNGKAFIDEQPLYRDHHDYDGDDDDFHRHDHDFDNDRRNHDDHGYGYGHDNGDNNDHNYDHNYDRNNDHGYGNNGDNRYGYDRVMNNDQFMSIKRMIQRESFDNTRLNIAKQVVDNNRFTAAQVKEIASLFSFDNGKLDFAEYAYRNTIDKNNYFILYDVFAFNSSKDALAGFLRSAH